MSGLAFLAALPILAIVVLMLFLRWPAARAGLFGLAMTVLLASVAFRDGTSTYARVGAVTATAGALLEAVFTTGTILWILFPALCLHHLQTRTGAVEVLRDRIRGLSSDRRIVAILVAWFFGLFMEGAAGFGTPVALAAPLLVSTGFQPVQAVTLALIGHAAGVSFGAIGTPVLPQVSVTPFSGLEIARATGLYHSLLGWVLLLVLVRYADRAVPATERSPGQVRGWAVLGAALFLAPFFALSRWVGPELPTLAGAAVGGLLFVGALRLARKGKPGAPPAGGAVRGRLLRAAAPYVALVALILFTRLVPAVQQALSGVEWRWTLDGAFAGSVRPLYHPGTMLFLGFFLGALYQRARSNEIRGAMAAGARQLVPVSIALVAMLGLSRVMVHAGMIETLALAAAAVGAAWPLLAAFVGVLGTFVTGSATASNILFTEFQEATAEHLRLLTLPLVGAQGFGAAVGNIICPHNLIAGGATVGIAGAEGEVLRRTLPPCIGYAALGGLLAYLLSA